jgi:hypothetical protein
MRRRVRDALVSAGAVVLLLLALIAFDDRVRDYVSRPVVAHRSAELAGAGQQLHDLTSVIGTAARDQTINHAPLLLFTLAAAVLVLFMVRT